MLGPGPAQPPAQLCGPVHCAPANPCRAGSSRRRVGAASPPDPSHPCHSGSCPPVGAVSSPDLGQLGPSMVDRPAV
eukprot:5047124-Alexandrium_andersonii.AAC.1